MSKVLARAMAKLGLSTRHPFPVSFEPYTIPMSEIRSLVGCEASCILGLDYESSLTDLSLEEREQSNAMLAHLKKEWNSLNHLLQWEWDLDIPDEIQDADGYQEKPMEPDHPVLKRIGVLQEYKWPLIWLLVYRKNKKVALWYDLEEYVDYTEEEWEVFRVESEQATKEEGWKKYPYVRF